MKTTSFIIVLPDSLARVMVNLKNSHTNVKLNSFLNISPFIFKYNYPFDMSNNNVRNTTSLDAIITLPEIKV